MRISLNKRLGALHNERMWTTYTFFSFRVVSNFLEHGDMSLSVGEETLCKQRDGYKEVKTHQGYYMEVPFLLVVSNRVLG